MCENTLISTIICAYGCVFLLQTPYVFASCICAAGFGIIKQICNEFNETGDIEQIYLLGHKQHDDLLRDAIKADNFLTEDDDRLLAALYGTTGKTVNVSFEKDGIVSPFAKFDRETLLRIIKTEDDISSYNFSNGKEGEKIIKMLGITWQNGLYHTNIKEVMFGGKVIYSK